MTFVAGQTLTAAQLNDLDIDSLVVDTDVLVVDKTGNRVGIGTTSPVNAKLHIVDEGEAIRMERSGYDTYGYQHSTGGGIEFRNFSDSRTEMIFAGNGTIGIGTTTPDHMLEIVSSGGTSNLRCSNDSGAEGFRVAATIVRSASIVGLTTGTAANVFINSANNSIYRSTSSIKYKTDVETMEDSFADAILGLRPVWYRSLGQDDPDSWGYWGFIAEEVAEVDPRLVSFGVPTDYKRQYDEDGEPIEPDVADLTEPEGVQYDRLVPHLVNLLARQRDQIADLSARVTTLEA